MSAPTLTISQTAQLLNISPGTLRYYEHEGLLSVPRRGHVRVYGPKELERLRFVLVLRATGMGMAALREYIALTNQGAGTLSECRALLVAHEQAVLAELTQLEEHLQAIRLKIHRYDTACGCHIQEAQV